jgi:hypothetical protein
MRSGFFIFMPDAAVRLFFNSTMLPACQKIMCFVRSLRYQRFLIQGAHAIFLLKQRGTDNKIGTCPVAGNRNVLDCAIRSRALMSRRAAVPERIAEENHDIYISLIQYGFRSEGPRPAGR